MISNRKVHIKKRLKIEYIKMQTAVVFYFLFTLTGLCCCCCCCFFLLIAVYFLYDERKNSKGRIFYSPALNTVTSCSIKLSYNSRRRISFLLFILNLKAVGFTE